jgi:hypothetical protein
MKAFAICLMLVGIVWALGVGWMYLVLSGIAEPISVFTTSFYYIQMLVGPILLIIGSIFILTGSHSKAGVIFTMIGCAILTALVAYNTVQDLHPKPLQAKPPYAFDVALLVVAVVVDIGALRMYQFISSKNAPGA